MTQTEKLNLMRELYISGSSLEDIAKETDLKVSTVNQMLSRTGISRKRNIEDCADVIISMRRSGKKLSKIAAKTGFNACVISSFLCNIGYGKYDLHGIPDEPEEEIDEIKLIFAEKINAKPEMLIVNGKIWWDYTKVYFPG